MIDAIGNSQSIQHYAHTINRIDNKQKYYRLKIVDENGDFDYTDIIASQNCDKIQLIQHIIQDEYQLKISTSRNATLQIVNQIGEVVFNQLTTNNLSILNKSKFSSGLYFIQAMDENAITETRKVLISN